MVINTDETHSFDDTRERQRKVIKIIIKNALGNYDENDAGKWMDGWIERRVARRIEGIVNDEAAK